MPWSAVLVLRAWDLSTTESDSANRSPSLKMTGRQVCMGTLQPGAHRNVRATQRKWLSKNSPTVLSHPTKSALGGPEGWGTCFQVRSRYTPPNFSMTDWEGCTGQLGWDYMSLDLTKLSGIGWVGGLDKVFKSSVFGSQSSGLRVGINPASASRFMDHLH